LDAVVSVGERQAEVHEEADFTVGILPAAPGKRGCVVRLLPLNAEETDKTPPLIHLYVSALSRAHPDGLWVNPDEVCVDDAPLLRGPWRKGDRFTVFGFGAWVFLVFNDHLFGTVHLEVDSVTAATAHLKYQFWSGRSGPAVHGEGEVTFENDAEGITAVQVNWTRTLGREKREVRLVIKRTGVSRLRESASPQSDEVSEGT
jgi:hypothetical protein